MQDKKNRITSLMLVPSGGGAFEVKVDGNLIWSKRKTHEFPTYKQVTAALG